VFSNWTETNSNQTYSSNSLSIHETENTRLIANFESASYSVMFSATSEDSVQKRTVGEERFTDSDKKKFRDYLLKMGFQKV